MCPLLWCRDTFEDLPSCLHHLLTCPWLTDSWYWCHFCHRPERFRVSEAGYNDSTNSPALGKASRLKRAVSFFKHFGRKSSTRVNISVAFFQMRDHSHCCLPELQASSSTTMPRSVQDLNDQEWRHDNQWTAPEPCEKGIDPDDCHDELKIKNYSVEHQKVKIAKPIHGPVQICGAPVAELPAYYQPRGSDTLENSTGNITCLDSNSVTYENKSAASPLAKPSSLNNVSAILSDPDALMPPWTSIFSAERTVYDQSSGIVDTASRSAVYRQGCLCDPRGMDHHRNPKGDISDLWLPFSCFGKGTNERNLSATEASVEDLSGLVSALHRSWMQNLTIGQPMVKAKISQCSPFETGIRVLLQYWKNGDLPNVFEDAFALMHIAFACAWMYHRDDTLGFWNTFFQDVLKWHHALLTYEDRLLFLKAADLIWSPPGSLSVEAIFPSGSPPLPYCSQPHTLIELEGNAPLEAPCTREGLPHESYTSSSHTFVDPTDLDFQNNEVIRSCARYLDGELSHNIIVCLPWIKLRVSRHRVLDYL